MVVNNFHCQDLYGLLYEPTDKENTADIKQS